MRPEHRTMVDSGNTAVAEALSKQRWTDFHAVGPGPLGLIVEEAGEVHQFERQTYDL